MKKEKKMALYYSGLILVILFHYQNCGLLDELQFKESSSHHHSTIITTPKVNTDTTHDNINTTQSIESSKLKVMNRDYIAGKFEFLFATNPDPSKVTTSIVSGMKSQTLVHIRRNMALFGGGCSILDQEIDYLNRSVCNGRSIDNNYITPTPGNSSGRWGKLYNFSEYFLETYPIAAVNFKDHAIKLKTEMTLNSDILAAYQLFYPGRTPSQEVLTKLQEVYNLGTTDQEKWKNLAFTLLNTEWFINI